MSGTREPGKERGTDGSSEGDSAEGVHSAPAGNYRITDDDFTAPKSTEIRFQNNLAAIKTLRALEASGQAPTPEQKDLLARYSGWGGMAELFAWSPGPAWASRAELVKVELQDDELAGAEASSTTAYFTPVPVARFIWQLAERLGFTGGNVLEPATGANGVFMGTMPPRLEQAVTLQGVEMDQLPPSPDHC